MLICSASVIAAGMLSSRISKRERWVEIYEIAESVSPEAEPYPFK